MQTPFDRYRPFRWGQLAGRATIRTRASLTRPEKLAWERGWLRPDRLALPDFLLVGMQKAATTWLSSHLRQHPDVFMVERPGADDPTEGRYFDRGFHATLWSYSRRFQGAGDRVTGDKSPLYCALPDERIRFVRTVVPDARIMFLLRDPVERAWSHALMNLVRLPGRSLEEVPLDRFREHFAAKHDLGLATVMIDRWQRHFPAEQLWLGFYDDVTARPDALLASAFTAIGVDPALAPHHRLDLADKVNANPEAPIPDVLRAELEHSYRDEIRAMRDRFGGAAEAWTARHHIAA